MYHNFIGVDISKADFAVAQHGVRWSSPIFAVNSILG